MHPIRRPTKLDFVELIPTHFDLGGARIVAGGGELDKDIACTRLEYTVAVVQIEIDPHAVDPRLAAVLLSIRIQVAPDEIANRRGALTIVWRRRR